MPKMTQNQIAVKIPLSQIVETGNVRTEYDADYIEQLATSILKNGLLQPIVVKRGEADANGLQQYELVAGHCRKRAFEWLCSQGYDFTNIDACIKTGDKHILQLIENVQRSELTAVDKETALKEMVAAGYTQTQIAGELSKPLSWVSDILKGDRVRQIVEAAGVDTAGIATKALSQVRSIPAEELPAAVEKIKENGGTVKAATEVLNQYREKMPEQMPQNGLVKKQTEGKQAAERKEEKADAEDCEAGYRLTVTVDEDAYILLKKYSYEENCSFDTAIERLVVFAKEKGLLKE